jgi:hypothetical protein
VTGAVLVPRTPVEGDRPLVLVTPGTRGIADHCAPSKQFALDQLDPRGPDVDILNVQQFLLRGFAVAVTDYEGNGTPGLSSYIVGRSEGYNGLDMIRAAQHLDGAGLSPDGPVGVAGYSQGGQAAAWVGELQSAYAPELDLRGVLAGGVVADVNTVIDHVNGNPVLGAGLSLAVLSGYGHAYPELDLDGKLTELGEQVMERVREGSCSADLLATYGAASSADVTDPDVLAEPAWRERFSENLLGTTAPAAPTYLYHGTADELVPYHQARTLLHDWCEQGSSVGFESVPGVEHVGGLVVGPLRGYEWLSDRLNGIPAPEGCREVGPL